MGLTIKQVIALSTVVLLAVLLIMLTAVSAWSFRYKLALIIAVAGGLLALFYFFNKRNPEAAARRRLAFGLLTLGSGALGWTFLRFDVTLSIFGLNVVLKAGDNPNILEQSGPFVIAVVAMVCATRLLCVPRPPPSSVLLGADWLKQLQSHSGPPSTASEHDLHTRIADDFAINPLTLVKRYIEPDCQPQNPADYNEDNPFTEFRKPVHDFLNHFLHKEFVEKDGSHVLFVLSDAGMGKSSLLVMLKLTHLSKWFWPDDTEVTLLKLGADTIEQITATSKKEKTVLLLDALDEDPRAFGRVSQRLEEILQCTTAFRQVIITVRTQFFPGGAPRPLESAGTVAVAGYRCSLIYLSPFSDEQVEKFLLKIFPNNVIQSLVKWIYGQDNAKFERARQIVIPMKSLRMRPMLLAHIESLLEASVEAWDEYSVYNELVRRWLQRESRKKIALQESRTRTENHEDDLRLACEYLAVRLQERGARTMTDAELKRQSNEQSELAHLTEIDIGGRSLLNRTSDLEWRFSHYTVQEFLVVSAFQARREFLQQRRERLRGTDQIFRFAMAVGEKAGIPEGIIEGVEWAGVRAGGEIGRWKEQDWPQLLSLLGAMLEGEATGERIELEIEAEGGETIGYFIEAAAGGAKRVVEGKWDVWPMHSTAREISGKPGSRLNGIRTRARWEALMHRTGVHKGEGGRPRKGEGEEGEGRSGTLQVSIRIRRAPHA